jgi:hypothetical protein
LLPFSRSHKCSSGAVWMQSSRCSTRFPPRQKLFYSPQAKGFIQIKTAILAGQIPSLAGQNARDHRTPKPSSKIVLDKRRSFNGPPKFRKLGPEIGKKNPHFALLLHSKIRLWPRSKKPRFLNNGRPLYSKSIYLYSAYK